MRLEYLLIVHTVLLNCLFAHAIYNPIYLFIKIT